MKLIFIDFKTLATLLKNASAVILEKGKSKLEVFIGSGISLNEKASWKPHWTICKYRGDKVCPENLYAIEEIQGNLLLNEGITELLKLLIGDGSALPFNGVNTYIGVGDSTTAAAATQTGLISSTNKAYKPLDGGFPQVSGQTVTFSATFGPNDANYEWREFTIANGNSNNAKNLNRKVEDHGRKNGDTWVIRLSVTLS